MITLCKNWSSFQFGILLLHIGAVLCLFLLPWQYWVMTIVAYLIINPTYQFVVHEYVSHRIVEPKNQWSKILVLVMYHMYSGDMSSKRSYHLAHHRHWQNAERDPTQRKIHANSFWTYLSGLGRPVDMDFKNIRHPSLIERSPELWFQNHSLIIKITVVALASLLLPWQAVCVFFILVPWTMTVVYNYHDWRFHGPEPRSDKNKWFPFFANQTWHIQHHQQPDLLYFGPGIFKYFNASWYLHKLCFRAL